VASRESCLLIRLADLLRDPRRRSDRFGMIREDSRGSFALVAAATCVSFIRFFRHASRFLRGHAAAFLRETRLVSRIQLPDVDSLIAESEKRNGDVRFSVLRHRCIAFAFPASKPALFSFSFLHFSEDETRSTSSSGFHVARRLPSRGREMPFVFRSKIQLARALTKRGGKRKMGKKKMKNPGAYFSSRGPF